MSAFHRTRNAALVGVVCAGLAVALVGCAGEDPDAGTNGIGKLSARKIESRVRTAVAGAGAVRLSGSLVSKGRTYELDLRLSKDGGTGRVRSKDASFELLRVKDDLYVKAQADFWKRQGGSEAGAAAASKLEGKYVRVPSGDPAYKQFSGFTYKNVLLDWLLGLHGKLAKGARGTVDGTRTIRLTGDGGAGGALDISLEGTPYPLRMQRAGGAGVVRLADWNQDFALKAPDSGKIVDYGSQIMTAG